MSTTTTPQWDPAMLSNLGIPTTFAPNTPEAQPTPTPTPTPASSPPASEPPSSAPSVTNPASPLIGDSLPTTLSLPATSSTASSTTSRPLTTEKASSINTSIPPFLQSQTASIPVPRSTTTTSSPSSSGDSNTQHPNMNLIIGLSIAVGMLVLAVVVGVLYRAYRKRQPSPSHSSEKAEDSQDSRPPTWRKSRLSQFLRLPRNSAVYPPTQPSKPMLPGSPDPCEGPAAAWKSDERLVGGGASPRWSGGAGGRGYFTTFAEPGEMEYVAQGGYSGEGGMRGEYSAQSFPVSEQGLRRSVGFSTMDFSSPQQGHQQSHPTDGTPLPESGSGQWMGSPGLRSRSQSQSTTSTSTASNLPMKGFTADVYRSFEVGSSDSLAPAGRARGFSEGRDAAGGRVISGVSMYSVPESMRGQGSGSVGTFGGRKDENTTDKEMEERTTFGMKVEREGYDSPLSTPKPAVVGRGRSRSTVSGTQRNVSESGSVKLGSSIPAKRSPLATSTFHSQPSQTERSPSPGPAPTHLLPLPSAFDPRILASPTEQQSPSIRSQDFGSTPKARARAASTGTGEGIGGLMTREYDEGGWSPRSRYSELPSPKAVADRMSAEREREEAKERREGKKNRARSTSSPGRSSGGKAQPRLMSTKPLIIAIKSIDKDASGHTSYSAPKPPPSTQSYLAPPFALSSDESTSKHDNQRFSTSAGILSLAQINMLKNDPNYQSATLSIYGYYEDAKEAEMGYTSDDEGKRGSGVRLF